ncbi:transposase-like protein [Purpureocillium lavendulum]|uniref:Transposase-like protein n=1 Tax=Purpureocillium lavendulum TaxID=1247861 RepID=A0AB34FI08_9HYPO|nr:transposase-like protein [Purpureocillium lavendulum]
MITRSDSCKEASTEDVEVAKTEHATSIRSQYESCISSISPAEQKKIIRRIDFRLVLTLGFLYAVSLMDRNNTGDSGSSTLGEGISGWRWIFILQGTLTCVIAFAAYILVLGFPDNDDGALGFHLSEKEAAFVVARIELDRQDVTPEKFRIGEYLSHALDLKIWGFAALFGLTTVNTYSLAYFLPLILRNGMGFSVAASQCLIAPPYIAAGIVMFTFAYFSDKYRIRSPFILFNGCLLLIGLPLLGFVENTGVRYLGAFITTTACNANVPCILTWQANNIRGQWKRAFCSATLVGTGGIGGIIGTTVFRSQDAPAYRPGMYATIGASGLIIIITLLLDWKLSRANKRAAAGGKPIGGLEGFRYTL